MRFGEGFVEEIKENGLAKVRVSRDSLYVACSVCAAADHVKLLAYNSIGAAEGDHVRYEVDDSHLISGAFVCFILPVVMLLVVALLGYLLVGHSAGAIVGGIAGAIVGGIAGLIVSALAVRKYDRSLSRIIDTKANILSVIVDEEEEKEENRT